MSPVINVDECVLCGACEADCPVGAISENDEGNFWIDPAICVNCEGYAESPQCIDACPSEAISL